MPRTKQRQIVRHFATGSITVVEARDAARVVKKSKSKQAKRGSAGRILDKAKSRDVLTARYLGHFGGGPAPKETGGRTPRDSN